MKTCSLFLLLAFLNPASPLLQWSPSLPDGQVLDACAGQEVDIPWAYTSGSGDVTSVTKWFFESGSAEMVAIFTDGNFVAMPAFTNRVEHMGEAGLKLKGIILSDSGNYSVEVIGHDAAGTSFSIHHSVVLQVSADLTTTDHLLHVHQKDEAKNSSATGEYHAVLSCGQFTFPSDPPFSVHWKTPSGQELNSTMYEQGFFLLFLPSNVEDDSTYTCVIPQDALPDSCLHSNASMADIRVSSVRAKMAVMDARQRDLESKIASVQSQMASVQKENQDLKQQISVQGPQEESNKTIAFHATLRGFIPSAHSGHKIALTDVITNEGGGYNATSSVFTAPLSGTYFFAASASPYADNTSAYMQLQVEGIGVAAKARAHQISRFDYQTGTCHAVVRLHADQKVWLEEAASGTFWDHEHSFFSGFRLH